MNNRYEKKLFLGFLNTHILYHASVAPIFGVWIIEELQHHGYRVGPSHIYPLLKKMCEEELLEVQENADTGRIRKYYSITKKGTTLLNELCGKICELTREIHPKEMEDDQNE
ncbi:MAG: hypothetical protein A2Y31_06740 [Spirochaetes bacterium GWC2_52_13]|nr:MAG: hypothetical protein A2Y31_06740 [Spirochaetes bacterium GWC2_52_13]